jgi:large subunit ribosomal protein L23
MIDPVYIIKALIHTEKSTLSEPDGKYLFLVDHAANKIQIKHAVEQLYKVKVSCINTFIAPGKKKKVRYHYGKTPDIKKALVSLKPGQKIDSAV